LTSASVSEKSKICKCYYILYRYKIVIVINIYVAVLQKPLLIGALGDHANSTLGQLAEKNLGRCFSVFGGQAFDNGIVQRGRVLGREGEATEEREMIIGKS
jgi:hypothetical protein